MIIKRFMSSYKILILFYIFKFINLFEIHISPINSNNIQDNNRDPLDNFLNMNKIAESLISKYIFYIKNIKKDSMNNDMRNDIIKEEENNFNPLDNINQKKFNPKGRVQIEERKTKNGMQRKVTRDLGNGMKTVEITEIFSRNNNNVRMNPLFNSGFPGMGTQVFPGIPLIQGMPGIGAPILIGRGNLKKTLGSPMINPINLFNEIDQIFDNFFDSFAEKIIKEKFFNRNQSNFNSTNNKDNFDIPDLDEIDLSLNETHGKLGQKHSEHEDHIKINYIKDLGNNLEESKKVEEIKKLEESHNEISIRPEDFGKNNEDNNHKKDVELIKEKILEAKNKKKNTENKKITKNPLFVRTCKVLFYFICIFSFYVLIKKLLEKNELLDNTSQVEDSSVNSVRNNCNYSDEIPLKQCESFDQKQQVNKID